MIAKLSSAFMAFIKYVSEADEQSLIKLAENREILRQKRLELRELQARNELSRKRLMEVRALNNRSKETN